MALKWLVSLKRRWWPALFDGRRLVGRIACLRLLVVSAVEPSAGHLLPPD
jgi:hypothetical protein